MLRRPSALVAGPRWYVELDGRRAAELDDPRPEPAQGEGVASLRVTSERPAGGAWWNDAHANYVNAETGRRVPGLRALAEPSAGRVLVTGVATDPSVWSRWLVS